MIRTVYMIEVIHEDMVIYRNFARNRKVAEKYAKRLKDKDTTVRKLTKDEMSFISLDDVLSK